MVKENVHEAPVKLEIVIWDSKYITGIKVIDSQHHQLIDLANELYNACIAKGDSLDTAFKDAMHKLVNYVHFHFDAELKLFNAIGYPERHNHKKMHDDLIKDILAAVKDYNEGKKFVPNHFVRTLRDWILSHIAIHDQLYSVYIHEQIKRGKLTEEALKEIEQSIEK